MVIKSKIAADTTIHVGHKKIAISNPDKLLFPKSGINKQIFVNYYKEIAQHLLPLLHNHVVTMLRFPDGINGESFFQKQVPDFFPKWIQRWPVTLKTTGQTNDYLLCNNAATLVYLANYVCVPHMWLSRKVRLDDPDRMIFDLDPPQPNKFNLVQQLALELHDLLTHLGLYPFAMLTGSSGMHVVVPIKRARGFDEVRAFARAVASYLVRQSPKLYTLEMSLAKRGQRVFIDTLRNSFGATAVVPYAIRNREGAPVAMPISWKEARDSNLSSQRYHLKEALRHVVLHSDPWDDFNKKAMVLTKAMRNLSKI